MIEDIRNWSAAIASLLAIISIFYTWLTARSKANEHTIGKHERKLIEHDRRIQTLESDVGHLPPKDDVHELRIALEQVRGALGRLEESHLGVTRVVNRIEIFLLDGGKER
ncbi:DUF2730 family protein [Stappia sp. F7233]|uniref:DUF2730 family protein n=1 Tax=Stappia albiluteola TaxID=2758565 RepID=A0A839AG22_9HYPH|nr:DUF2730 family protein [Stappia albiluteola]MBA5777461.1 DUF2730 family protein [Stappia albiluteola]MBA5777499.1 DUF2730 family protein [Stappia albiluteola]MBA5778090.1 DUF2730 family protein [Stappia albiluteola]MBA5778133.1 DUF2730 family protein [Stappia albiluteola]